MSRNVVFLASPEVWAQGHGPNHPLKPERLQRTYHLLKAYGTFDLSNMELVAPTPPTEEELHLFHTLDYVQAVRALSEGRRDITPGRYNFGPGDNPVFRGMYDSEGLKVGSALQAARMIHEGRTPIAFSYSGGLHHGGPDFASGFCVFNDVAVALSWLVERGRRPIYIDIDVHHGDGVQDAFYDSGQVMTVSLHQDPRTLFPGTGFVHELGEGPGEGCSVNLPLPPWTDDETYLDAFFRLVPPLLDRFQPDILATQLGVDTHVRDPLAQLALTTHGLEQLFEYFASVDLPWLAFGGGGYNLDVVPRSWTLAVGAMLGHQFPGELPEEYRDRFGGQRLHDRPHELNVPGSAEVWPIVDRRLGELERSLGLKSG